MAQLKFNLSKINANWKKTKNFFVSYELLKIFDAKNKDLTHLYFEDRNSIIYAQFFNISFEKASNYLRNSIIIKYVFKFFKVPTLFLTNSFFTNVPSYDINDNINLNKLITCISNKINFFLIVIPSDLYEKFNLCGSNDFTKIEIEDDMYLKINKSWKNTNDYISSLKTKYRKKINIIIKNSSVIKNKEIEQENFSHHSDNLQSLFDQIIYQSSFNGPNFNVDTLHAMIEKKFCKVYGYFLNDSLVGFSSIICFENKLYSYYVGFDKKLNHKYSIYGKILFDSINYAISKNLSHVVYGRTANEYKSNFGAVPKTSYIYIKAKNNFINNLLKFIFRRIKKKKWILRKPFKSLNL